jgi:hypothetical protein
VLYQLKVTEIQARVIEDILTCDKDRIIFDNSTRTLYIRDDGSKSLISDLLYQETLGGSRTPAVKASISRLVHKIDFELEEDKSLRKKFRHPCEHHREYMYFGSLLVWCPVCKEHYTLGEGDD